MTLDGTTNERTTTRAGSPPRAGGRGWLALVVLMLPVLMISLDNTVLSFAVPQVSRALRPSDTQLLWLVDVYPLCLAGLLVTMGVLGDRLGRRRLLLVGAAGFGLTGLAAAFAPNIEILIAARALRGVFGATLMPSTLSLLRNVFLDPAQRRLAIAIWASGFAGGAALGPIVGGWLLEHFWWGSAFLVAVPLTVVLLAVGPALLPESRHGDAGRLDVPSIAASVLAMLPVVFGIKHLATTGLDATAAASLLAGAFFAAVFVRRQMTVADPLLDLRLFRHRVFSASIVANFCSIFAWAGLVFYLSQYLQLVLRLRPMEAGTYLLPGALASIAAGLLAVRLAAFASLRVLVAAGIGVSALGYGLAATLTAATPGLVIVVVFVLVGTGVGLAETLTNDAILASVPAQRAGAAAGISETAYELGTSLGVAVLGSVLAATYRSRLALPSGLTGEAADAASQTLGGAAAVAERLPGPTGRALMEAARGAFMTGVETASLIAALLTAGTALFAALALRTRG